MDEQEMTDAEFAQVARACAWVRVTAGFLPFLRGFVAARLARHQPRLSLKIAGFTSRQIYLLWQRLKDEQAAPDPFPDRPAARAAPNATRQSQH